MRHVSPPIFAAFSLAVCLSLASPASADDNATKATAPSDSAANDIAACIGQNGDFQSRGKVNSFVFTIENKCEKRLKCTIDAYVTGAKGPDSGHGTLIVGPKSDGDAAKKSFSMRVKVAAGTAQVSHNCKVF
jgi:hypothetical protein